jgi:drug/metabolite transporter (DMT)-like permease
MALLGYAGYAAFMAWSALGGVGTPGAPTMQTMQSMQTMLLGPTPARYLLLMLTIGLLASWLGTLCWNEASQRLPTRLVGQLIVFETLAALGYAFVLRGHPPDALTLSGVMLLVAGVVLGLRRRPTHGPAG